MIKRLSQYFFKNAEEIGFENYLVLILCFLIGVIGLLGTVINLFLGLSPGTVLSTLIPAVIFTPVYIYSWKTRKFFFSKYLLIVLSLFLLNFQWFVNYGSSGPIIYLFVVLESFILIFFGRLEKVFLTIFVFVNVTVLFYIEYAYPSTIGKYSSVPSRLLDLYFGTLIYLFLSILLLSIAIKHYIAQQEKAQLADKLKTAFLANMSHEIRTPMNGILGFAELLKEPNLTGEEQMEYINIIERSGVRMLNIINDIIDISKIESGLMEVDIKETDINEQIDYIYTFFKPEVEKKGMQLFIKSSLSHGDSIIRTDREKLYAILINLVKNAIKYSHSGYIEIGYTKKLLTDAPELEFYVKDTGIGIPKDRHKAIFERFIQADIYDKQAYQGAGLGLAISKAYVEMLGGKIWVESEPSKGSVFYFTIPCEAKIAHKKENLILLNSEEDEQKVKKLKILIAEDDETSEMLIVKLLKNYNSEILRAKTGVEAVNVCRSNSDIELVFMDIQMPEMNGYEATQQIRKFNKHVIIIAQTAFALSGDREKAIKAGCNDYISKPINSDDLKGLIRKYSN